MNPYRESFYKRQAEWHGYVGPADVERRHQAREPYYRWYVRGWLDDLPKDTSILDIGCGCGQFLYYSRAQGFSNAMGIDVDLRQTEIGQALGLNCQSISALEFLLDETTEWGVITMFDILEHFTREELFPLLEAVRMRLAPGGRLIVSVPNASSPRGLQTVYADITHELSFTPGSLEELFFCHGLSVRAMRDPWPAPVSFSRRCHRALATCVRRLEALRLRLLGLDVPEFWSPVVLAMAEKPRTPERERPVEHSRLADQNRLAAVMLDLAR